MNKSTDFLSPHLWNFFKNYIELDTSLASGENYPKAILLLQAMLKGLDFETEVVSIPVNVAKGNNRQHLIARKFASNKLPTVLIYNHIDVVSADYPHAFVFSLKDGKVFGRGASDHKGGTVAVLDAFEKLLNKNIRFNLVFWVTTDEETDQLDQLRFMTHKLKLPKNTLVYDTDTFAGGVTIAHLGSLQFSIKILGKSAHSAMSNLGVNSIEQAALLISHFFSRIKLKYEKQVSEFKAFRSSNLKFVCSRCNVNTIAGGNAINTIPEYCKFQVDCRYIPEANTYKEKETLIQDLEKFCKKNYIHVEINNILITEGYGSNSKYGEELSKLYRKVSGESELCCILGSTPLAQWAKDQGLPHIGLGVARGENNVHGVGEFVTIKDMDEVSRTLQKFLVNKS